MKVYLEKSDSTHDALLTMFIQQVSARIQTYLNRELKAEERTEYFDAGEKQFSLKAYPIDTEETFTVNWSDEEQEIDEDYFLYDTIGIVEFPYGTGQYDARAIDITYTGGYTDTDSVLAVPDDLKRACFLQVAFDFKRRKDLGLSSISMPDGSMSVYQPARFLPEVTAILNSFRRMPIC
jgi:hypothetical protein